MAKNRHNPTTEMPKTKAEVRDRMMQDQAAARKRIAAKEERLPEAADHRRRAELGIDKDDGCWHSFSEDERVEPVWASGAPESGAPESGAPESGGESPARLGGSDRNPIVIDDDEPQPPPAKRPRSPSETGIIEGAFDSEISYARHDDHNDKLAIADGAAALVAFAAGGPPAAPDELPLLTDADVAMELGN